MIKLVSHSVEFQLYNPSSPAAGIETYQIDWKNVSNPSGKNMFLRVISAAASVFQNLGQMFYNLSVFPLNTLLKIFTPMPRLSNDGFDARNGFTITYKERVDEISKPFSIDDTSNNKVVFSSETNDSEKNRAVPSAPTEETINAVASEKNIQDETVAASKTEAKSETESAPVEKKEEDLFDFSIPLPEPEVASRRASLEKIGLCAAGIIGSAIVAGIGIRTFFPESFLATTMNQSASAIKDCVSAPKTCWTSHMPTWAGGTATV